MQSITERDLAVLITVLAEKIDALSKKLRATEAESDKLTGKELEGFNALQDLLEQYDLVMENLKDDYETALANGVNLPSYADLTSPYNLD